MSDETTKVMSKDELLAAMKDATGKGDWKAVKGIATNIAKMVAAEEKSEKDAKLKALESITATVKGKMDTAVSKIVDGLDKATLEAMDGVWYVNDFGEQLTTCRLSKSATRKGGGGGGGKKFSVTTKDLLDKHGAEPYKDTGATFQEAYDSDTDGNSRYKVRMWLLKAEGLS